jgi:hypothetical protein
MVEAAVVDDGVFEVEAAVVDDGVVVAEVVPPESLSDFSEVDLGWIKNFHFREE